MNFFRKEHPEFHLPTIDGNTNKRKEITELVNKFICQNYFLLKLVQQAKDAFGLDRFGKCKLPFARRGPSICVSNGHLVRILLLR